MSDVRRMPVERIQPLMGRHLERKILPAPMNPNVFDIPADPVVRKINPVIYQPPVGARPDHRLANRSMHGLFREPWFRRLFIDYGDVDILPGLFRLPKQDNGKKGTGRPPPATTTRPPDLNGPVFPFMDVIRVVCFSTNWNRILSLISHSQEQKIRNPRRITNRSGTRTDSSIP